jgi:hypothetical protein
MSGKVKRLFNMAGNGQTSASGAAVAGDGGAGAGGPAEDAGLRGVAARRDGGPVEREQDELGGGGFGGGDWEKGGLKLRSHAIQRRKAFDKTQVKATDKITSAMRKPKLNCPPVQWYPRW